MTFGLPLLIACGKTSYAPAKSARVSVTSEGFVRDGIMYPDVAGGGLVEALHDSPRAQAEARKAHSFLLAGFVCSIGGLAAEGAGLGMVIAGIEPADANRQAHFTTLSGVGAGVAIGGIVAAFVGISLLTSGNAHVIDAINMHNDSLDLDHPPLNGPLR